MSANMAAMSRRTPGPCDPALARGCFEGLGGFVGKRDYPVERFRIDELQPFVIAVIEEASTAAEDHRVDQEDVTNSVAISFLIMLTSSLCWLGV
jgi:hypothetical protein